MLSTTCICGMALEKIHMAWTGPVTSTFEKILDVLGEPSRVSLLDLRAQRGSQQMFQHGIPGAFHRVHPKQAPHWC